MDAIQKASELYMTKFKEENQVSNSSYDQKKLDDDIHRYISIAVKSIQSAASLFKTSSIFDSLINALRVCVSNDGDVKALYTAYNHLEKYFCLLVQQPWKSEFKVLKTYSGFYKTKIKSVLAKAETIFQSAGYAVDQDNQMVYGRVRVDKMQLLILSFDCFVAAEICSRIHEQYNQLKTVGKSLDDAVFDILQNSWPRDIVRENALSNKPMMNVGPPPEVPKREPLMNGVGSSNGRKHSNKEVLYSHEPSPVYDANIRSQHPEVSLGNFKYKPNADPHIPFIDEAEHYPKLSQATSEEHQRESLKVVAARTQPFSDEWKYRPAQDLRGMTPSDSHQTYPPKHVPRSQYHQPLPTDFFRDEGIVQDISQNPKSTFGSVISPYATHSVLSKSAMSDQGYGTGTTYSNVTSTVPADMTSETIYRPPPLNSQGKLISQNVPPTSKNLGLPPPIPSRELKPRSSTTRGEDEVDGHMFYNNTNISRGQADRVELTAPPHPDALLPLQALNAGPDLRPPRSLHMMKSRSLRSDTKKVISDDRVSKSMDYSKDHWTCPMCDTLNSAVHTNCFNCALNRYSSPQREQKKTCAVCTLDNDWQLTKCAACDQPLPTEFTYYNS